MLGWRAFRGGRQHDGFDFGRQCGDRFRSRSSGHRPAEAPQRRGVITLEQHRQLDAFARTERTLQHEHRTVRLADLAVGAPTSVGLAVDRSASTVAAFFATGVAVFAANELQRLASHRGGQFGEQEISGLSFVVNPTWAAAGQAFIRQRFEPQRRDASEVTGEFDFIDIALGDVATRQHRSIVEHGQDRHGRRHRRRTDHAPKYGRRRGFLLPTGEGFVRCTLTRFHGVARGIVIAERQTHPAQRVFAAVLLSDGDFDAHAAAVFDRLVDHGGGGVRGLHVTPSHGPTRLGIAVDGALHVVVLLREVRADRFQLYRRQLTTTRADAHD